MEPLEKALFEITDLLKAGEFSIALKKINFLVSPLKVKLELKEKEFLHECLLLSCSYSNYELVLSLLNKQLNPQYKNNQALCNAIIRPRENQKFKELKQLYLEKGDISNLNKLIENSEDEQLSIVKVLFDRGADVNTTSIETSFRTALDQKLTNIVLFLLAQTKSKSGKRLLDIDRNKVLYLAHVAGAKEIYKALVFDAGCKTYRVPRIIFNFNFNGDPELLALTYDAKLFARTNPVLTTPCKTYDLCKHLNGPALDFQYYFDVIIFKLTQDKNVLQVLPGIQFDFLEGLPLFSPLKREMMHERNQNSERLLTLAHNNFDLSGQNDFKEAWNHKILHYLVELNSNLIYYFPNVLTCLIHSFLFNKKNTPKVKIF
jgi:hypothetical protein